MPATPIDPTVNGTPTNVSELGPDFRVDAGTGRSVGVYVEQGPEWLAALLVDPPMWLVFFVAGVCCLLAAGALWSYQRHGIDRAVVEGIARNLVVVGCVGTSVYALRSWTSLSYLEDVVFGLAIGLAAAVVLFHAAVRPMIEAKWIG